MFNKQTDSQLWWGGAMVSNVMGETHMGCVQPKNKRLCRIYRTSVIFVRWGVCAEPKLTGSTHWSHSLLFIYIIQSFICFSRNHRHPEVKRKSAAMSCNMTKLRDGKSLECATFHFCLLVFNGGFFVVVGFVRNHRTDSAAFQAVHGESRKWADLGTAKCFFLLDWQKTCWARPENIIFGHLCYVTCTQGNKAQLQKWNLKPMRRHVQRDLRTARTMVCY